MKFSEFMKQDDKPKIQAEDKQQENVQNLNEEDVAHLYDKYKNLSHDELMKTLITNIENQKRNGTFDFYKLKNSIDLIMPYLSEEQKINISKLLEEINNNNL